MRTISMRDLQKHIRDCVSVSQRDRVVVTRHGIPAALIIGVKGADWEMLSLQTSPSFWRIIEKRRRDKTVSLYQIRQLMKAKHPS